MANELQQKKLSNLEVSSFCEQMAMILKSGISALEGISILKEDARPGDEEELLGAVYDTMQETGLLYPALEETGVFPDYMLRMVEIGEETGTLDEVIDSLSGHYAREAAIAQSIKSALTYPLIMIGMMLLVILILITQVMPVFSQVFRQLGREMNSLSRGILALGNTISKYAYVFVGIVVIAALVLLFLTRTEKGRSRAARIGQHFRFTRELSDKMAASRFAGGMSLVLRSGLTPERGLEFTETLIDNEYFLKKIVSCKEKIKEGSDLSAALQETKIFTGVYARMVSIAGKTGMMDEIMGQIADAYSEEVDEKVQAFIAALEPTLVIVLSVIVGTILLSVMLPLLGIMSGL